MGNGIVYSPNKYRETEGIKDLFNKSHSFSYAVLCLQTAYLKAHHPIQFYKALFNLRKSDGGRLNKYVNDALENGVKVLPPNINKSEMDFIIDNNKILFGLTSISGMGESTVKPIIEKRKNGKFTSMEDFMSRYKASESEMVALIKSGAIPCKNKRDMMLKYANTYLLNRKEFGGLKSIPSLRIMKDYGIDTDIIKDKEERLRLYNKVKEKEFYQLQNSKNSKIIDVFTEKYLKNEEMWEFETLSIFLTHNPFKEVSKIISNYEEAENNTDVTTIGVISQVVLKKNKRKQQYAFINLCTAYGLIQIACWATQYAMYSDHIKRGSRVALICRKEDESSYAIRELKTYEQWKHDKRDLLQNI